MLPIEHHRPTQKGDRFLNPHHLSEVDLGIQEVAEAEAEPRPGALGRLDILVRSRAWHYLDNFNNNSSSSRITRMGRGWVVMVPGHSDWHSLVGWLR